LAVDGQYHQALATYDGITRSLYLDGKLENSDTPGDPPSNTGVLYIGVPQPIPEDARYSLEGKIAMVMIIARSFSPNEVLDSYQQPDAMLQRPMWAYLWFVEFARRIFFIH
jgi:hypothetical protein